MDWRREGWMHSRVGNLLNDSQSKTWNIILIIVSIMLQMYRNHHHRIIINKENSGTFSASCTCHKSQTKCSSFSTSLLITWFCPPGLKSNSLPKQGGKLASWLVVLLPASFTECILHVARHSITLTFLAKSPSINEQKHSLDSVVEGNTTLVTGTDCNI